MENTTKRKNHTNKEPFAFLKHTNSKLLAKLFTNEHPQTVAMALAHMNTHEASEVLGLLSADLKIEVAIRISNLKDVSPSIVANASRLLENKLNSLTKPNVEDNGVARIAKIFHAMGSKIENTLELMEMYDKNLSKEIKEEMDSLNIKNESHYHHSIKI